MSLNSRGIKRLSKEYGRVLRYVRQANAKALDRASQVAAALHSLRTRHTSNRQRRRTSDAFLAFAHPESLEQRVLLTVTLSGTPDEVVLTGTAAGETIELQSLSPTMLRATSPGSAPVDFSIPATSITIDAGLGGDSIHVSSIDLTGHQTKLIINDGGGDDTITVTSSTIPGGLDISDEALSIEDITDLGVGVDGADTVTLSGELNLVDSKLNISAETIDISDNASISTTGDVILKATSIGIKDVQGASPINFPSMEASVTIGKGVSIEADNIVVAATGAEKDLAPLIVSALGLPPVTKLAAAPAVKAVLDKVPSLPVKFLSKETEATITVKDGASLTAVDRVSLKSSATAKATGSVKGSVISIGVVGADASARVIFENGEDTVIDAGTTAFVGSNAITEAKIESKTAQGLGSGSAAVGLGVSISDITSHVIVPGNVTIHAGKTVNIAATGDNKTNASAEAGTKQDGTVGLTFGLGFSDADIKTEVGGTITADMALGSTVKLEFDPTTTDPNTIGYIDPVENTIRVGPHGLSTGDKVSYSNRRGLGISGLVTATDQGPLVEQDYFVITTDDPQKIKLAANSVKASKGVEIDFGNPDETTYNLVRAVFPDLPEFGSILPDFFRGATNAKTFDASNVDSDANTIKVGNAPNFDITDPANFTLLGSSFELGQPVRYTVSPGGTPINGLTPGNVYYVIASTNQFNLQGDSKFVLEQVLQLAESENEAVAGNALTISISEADDQATHTLSALHILDSGLATGVGIVASLATEDKASTSSGLEIEDAADPPLTPDGDLTPEQTAEAETIPAEVLAAFGGDEYSANADASGVDAGPGADPDAGQSGSNSLQAAAAFSFMLTNHSVTTDVLGTADIQSNEDIEVRAEISEQLQLNAESSVDSEADGAVSAAVIIGLNNNTAQATVANGAQLDALRATRVISDITYPYLTRPDEYIPANFGELIEVLKTDAKSLRKYLDGQFGLKSELINTWAQSTGKAGKVSVAGSVNFLDFNNTSEAVVQSGVQINQDLSHRDNTNTHANNTGQQVVSVEATNYMQFINVTGVFDFDLSPDSIAKLIESGDPLGVANPVASSGDKGGIGGALFLSFLTNTTNSIVDSGAAIHTGHSGSFNLKAEEAIAGFNFSQAGASSGTFGVAGTVAYVQQRSKNRAHLSSGVQVTGGTVLAGGPEIDAPGSPVTVYAGNLETSTNWAGAVAKGDNLGFGITVAINDIERDVEAIIGSEADDASSDADDASPGASTINASGAVKVDAKVDGALHAFSIAAAVAGGSDPPAADADLQGVAEGGGESDSSKKPQYGVSISANVSINNVKDDVFAYIYDAGTISAPELEVVSFNKSELVAFAAAASVTLPSSQPGGGSSTAVAIAGSFGKNKLTGNTDAYIKSATLDVADGGSLVVTADRSGAITAISAGIGVAIEKPGGSGGQSTSVAVAGSVSINEIDNTTNAFLESVKDDPNPASPTGTSKYDATVSSSDDSSIFALAGALSLSVGDRGAAVGVSVAINTIGSDTMAEVTDSQLVHVAQLGLAADNKSSIKAISFAGAAGIAAGSGTSGNFTASGAGARNVVQNVVDAHIKDSSNLTATDISVTATDASSIIADVVGAAVGVSASSGGNTGSLTIGVSISRNQIDNDVSAYVANSNIETTSGDIDVSVTEKSDITATSVAASVAASFSSDNSIALSGGGAEASNEILTKANAYAKDSTLTSASDIGIIAMNESKIDSTVVAVSISISASGGNSGAASVGAARARNFIGHRLDGSDTGDPTAQTRAYVMNSTVVADDMTIESIAEQEINARVGAGSAAVSASSGNALGLSGAGVETENKIRADIKAFIEGGLPTSESIKVGTLTVVADDTSSISAIAGAASLAVAVGGSNAISASIGVSLARNEVSNDVAAHITDAHVTTNSGDITLESTTQGRELFESTDLDSAGESVINRLNDAAITDEDLDDEEHGDINEQRDDEDNNVAQISHIREYFRTKVNIELPATNFGFSSNETLIDGLAAGTRVKNGGQVYEFVSEDDIDGPTPLGSQTYSDREKWKLVDDLTVNILEDGKEWSISSADGSYIIQQVSPGVLRIYQTTIEAISVAASISAAVGSTAGIAISGAGADAINSIHNKTNAFASDSIIVSAGDVDVDARNSAGIIAKVAAVSAGIGVGGTAGVGASIGVAVARNQIGWKVYDGDYKYSTDGNDTPGDPDPDRTPKTKITIAPGDKVLIAKGPRTGDIYKFVGATHNEDGEALDLEVDLRMVDYSDPETWEQVNIRNQLTEPNATEVHEVQAYLERSAVNAVGDVTLDALNDATIEAGVGAGSIAVAVGGTAGVGVSGAGVSAENRIATRVKSYISGDSGTGIEADNVKLKALDTSSIDVTAAAASVAAAFGGTAAVSVSIGVSLARNSIENIIETTVQDAAVVARDGHISLDADANSSIDALSVAVSVSVAISGTAGIAFSGAGAESTNVIANTVQSSVTDSDLNAGGNVIVHALSESSIVSTVGAVSAAVGASATAGVAGSVGVSVARNLIGFDTDGNDGNNRVVARIVDSTVNAGGDVDVKALADDTSSIVSFAGSVAIAGGIGVASVAVSAATATSEFGTQVFAYIADSTIESSGSVIVTADSDSKVTKALAVGASLSVAIGLGAGISVAASVVENTIQDDVRAYISGASGDRVQASGDVAVNADMNAQIRGVEAVTASVSGGLANASGGGIGFDNRIEDNVDAYISGPIVVTSGGNTSVKASEYAYLEADASNVAVGIGIGAALGVSKVENRVYSNIDAEIGGATVNSRDTTVNARSHVDVPKTKAVGVSAQLIGIASTTNLASVDINTKVHSDVTNSHLNSSGSIFVTANSDNFARTSSNGGAVSTVAIGAMESEITLGRKEGANQEEVMASVNGGTVRANALNIAAISNDDLFAESLAAGGGVIAGAGAKSEVDSNFGTLATIGDGTSIDLTSSLSIASSHEQIVDSKADSYAIALGAGSGAGLDNDVNTKANISIGDADVTAHNIVISAKNKVRKAGLSSDSTDLDERSNLRSGSASIGNISLLLSSTEIGTSSNPFEAKVDIKPGANLKAMGTNQNPSIFRVDASTDVFAFDSVGIESVSGFGVSAAKSEINTNANADILINGAILENNAGNLQLATKGDSQVTSDANLLVATALTGGGGAGGITDVTVNNRIFIDNAELKGTNVNAYAGRSSQGVPNIILANAAANITAFSFLPNISIPNPQVDLTENNLIFINQSSTGQTKIQGLEDVNLLAVEGIGGDNRVGESGMVLSLSLIPYGAEAVDNPEVNTANWVNVGQNAIVEAGVNSSSVVIVRPVIDEQPGGLGNFNTALYDTQLTPADKAAENLPQSVKYEYVEPNLGELAYKVTPGTIVKVVGGAHGGGTVESLYQFRGAATEEVLLENENYNNASRWRLVTSTSVPEVSNPTTGEAIPGTPSITEVGGDFVESNVADSLRARLNDQIYIIKPVELDAPTLSLANIGQLLLEQREVILGWIGNHSTEAESVARYQEQLRQLDATLEDLGLLNDEPVFDDDGNPTGQTVKLPADLDAIFVNIPNLRAAPGSIFIEADESPDLRTMLGSIKNTQLFASTEAEIRVLNQSPFAMALGDAIITDNKKVVTVGDSLVTLQPGNVYLNNTFVGTDTGGDAAGPGISITQKRWIRWLAMRLTCQTCRVTCLLLVTLSTKMET